MRTRSRRPSTLFPSRRIDPVCLGIDGHAVEAHGKIVLRDGEPILDLLNGEPVALASDPLERRVIASPTALAHADAKGPDIATVPTVR